MNSLPTSLGMQAPPPSPPHSSPLGLGVLALGIGSQARASWPPDLGIRAQGKLLDPRQSPPPPTTATSSIPPAALQPPSAGGGGGRGSRECRGGSPSRRRLGFPSRVQSIWCLMMLQCRPIAAVHSSCVFYIP